MTPSSEQVRAFLNRFRTVSFPHASEVVSLLDRERPGVTIELWTGAKLQELQSIYRIRAEGLASRPLGPTFPGTLPMEVRALADALDAAEEQQVRIWHLALSDGRVFVVFELVDAQRIAGVVESADQRVVAPPSREELI